MRKVKLLATCWLVFFICIACGQKKSNYDYQGACYENDFEKAHLILIR